MPLEEILKSIEERLSTEKAAISKEYADRMAELERKTQSEIERIEREYRERADREIRALESREISAAEIEARRLVRDRKGELIRERVSEAFELIDSLPSDKEYPEILHQMVTLAKKMLGKNCTVHVKQGEAKLISSIKGIKVEEQDIDPHGGVLCISHDGQRELDLTLTTVKKDLAEAITLAVSERMGGE